MKQTIYSLLLLCSLTTLAQGKKMQELKENIILELSVPKGHFAVAFYNLSGKDSLFINEKENFHAASTMKMAVLIELFKQAAEGRFSLADSIELKNEFKSIVDSSLYSLNAADDSELELYKHPGEKRRIDSLIYLMITVSSNFSTNLLIQLAGAENCMHTLNQIGVYDMRVLRGVEDQKAFEKGLNNTVTAYDLMLIFKKIARAELLSREASQAMTNILLNQKFNEIIPALLPPDVRVAHKTGSIKGVNHDAGFVILPDGRKYVLVFLSKDVEDEKQAIAAMAKVSLLVYNYVLKH